jgi:hypothetical protein
MGNGFMAELSRHGSTHAFDWPSHKIAVYRCKKNFLPFTEVKRSRQAECSREGGLGSTSGTFN